MIFHSRPTIEKDDFKAIFSVLDSRMIACGKKVLEFESRLKEFIGGKSAVATNSGKSALLLALLTIGAKKGDEVILPTYVCRDVYDIIRFVGAKPVIVDVDDDYCISPQQIKENITPKTKAVIIVHIFGISAKIKEIIKITKEKNIYAIEDCAQSIGGKISGKKLGSFGDLSFFSFHATKVLTTGEGGALAINKKALLDDYGANVVRKNINFFRMSDLQASLGLSQFKKINDFLLKRKELARLYIELLSGEKDIEIPVSDVSKSIFFRFPVKIKKNYDFDNLKSKFEKQGVQIRKGVDMMLHQIERNRRCPVADEVFEETVSLPIYPSLGGQDVNLICRSFKNSFLWQA